MAHTPATCSVSRTAIRMPQTLETLPRVRAHAAHLSMADTPASSVAGTAGTADGRSPAAVGGATPPSDAKSTLGGSAAGGGGATIAGEVTGGAAMAAAMFELVPNWDWRDQVAVAVAVTVAATGGKPARPAGAAVGTERVKGHAPGFTCTTAALIAYTQRVRQ